MREVVAYELAVPVPLPAHRQATPLAQALAATGDRWTLLIVLALADDTVRLNTLRRRLPGVSSAVLDDRVRRMVSLGLLSRRRFREMPPRVELALTDSGTALLPIASALARWGMRYRWSEHASCDGVDADAVLRQLPALLEDAELPTGVVETIVDAGEHPVSHRFEIVDGKLRPLGDPVPKARRTSASIEGDVAAWQAALGPDRDCDALQSSGRRRLAAQIFDALPAPCS
jgi:DNA-binding HxlR family transcriptional regulator